MNGHKTELTQKAHLLPSGEINSAQAAKLKAVSHPLVPETKTKLKVGQKARACNSTTHRDFRGRERDVPAAWVRKCPGLLTLLSLV